MTATDELRELLDERGVDWRRWSGNSKRKTQWFMPNSNIGSDMPGGYCVTVSEHKDGTLYFNSMIAAPEQAIAATLGAGTCHDLGGTGAYDERVFNCSECGCVLSLYDRDGTNTLCTGFIYDYPRYCPACGAKVVEG